MNWFLNLTSYEEISKRYNELASKYYHRERILTKEEKEIMAEINKQYVALPAVIQHKAEKAKAKVELEKDKKTPRYILSSVGYEKFDYKDEMTYREARVYALDMLENIEISGKDNNELQRGILTKHIAQSALSQEITQDSYQEFYDKNKDLAKDGIEFSMKYLNSVEYEIASSKSKDFYTGKFFEDVKKMEHSGITLGIRQKGKDRVEIKFNDDEDVDDEVEANPNLKMLKNAVENSLDKIDYNTSKEDIFYNMLQAKNIDAKSMKSVRHIILGQEEDEEVSMDEIKARANKMVDLISNSKQVVRADGKVHNRDKVADLTRLYIAYRRSNNFKKDKEFGEKILNEIEKYRIHNIKLGFRGLKQDYINQQKDIDHIRYDIGMTKRNKWQEIAGVPVDRRDLLNPDEISEHQAEPVTRNNLEDDDSMSVDSYADKGTKLNLDSFSECGNDSFINQHSVFDEEDKKEITSVDKPDSSLSDRDILGANGVDATTNPFEDLDGYDSKRKSMTISKKDLADENEIEKTEEISKSKNQIYPPIGQK